MFDAAEPRNQLHRCFANSAIFRPAAKRLLSVSRPACLVVAQKFSPRLSRRWHAANEASFPTKQTLLRQPGRASGLVAKSYFLLFLAAFFVEAFFVDFLAVFLAAAM